jgi:hypothetical protein
MYLAQVLAGSSIIGLGLMSDPLKGELICKVRIPIAIPSYWQWRTWHWSKQRSLQDDVLLLLKVQKPKSLPLNSGKPLIISFCVYKKVLRGDAQNYVTPFDKLVLDNITQPKGNKKRGLGWLVDDSPEFLNGLEPHIEKAADGAERTVVRFYEADG